MGAFSCNFDPKSSRKSPGGARSNRLSTSNSCSIRISGHYGDGTELFWQKREDQGGGIEFRVESEEPMLRVAGNPEVTVEDGETLVLAWPDGAVERHEYSVLKGRPFELSLDEFQKAFELDHSEERIEEVIRRLGLEKRMDGGGGTR